MILIKLNRVVKGKQVVDLVRLLKMLVILNRENIRNLTIILNAHIKMKLAGGKLTTGRSGNNDYSDFTGSNQT